MNLPMLVLKKEVLDRIKKDADLFGIVAKSIKVSPSTLPNVLNRNSSKLTQASTLNAIKAYTGLSESELLTEDETTIA